MDIFPKMSEDFYTNYKDGDIVWVKLGPSWWPGEVKDLNNIPTDEIEFKKPPLVVVKFFEEDTYEYVRSWANIYPYNSDKKVEFIKKGMSAFHSKASHMEKFPKDVVTAEVKTGGNPNILSDPAYRPEVKRHYTVEVSGSQNTKKKTSKESKKSKSHYHRDTSHITHRRFLGCDDYKAYICIQYPGKDRTPGDSEDEEVIRINTEPEHEYNCHSCSYSTKRLEVMILHTKSHIQGNYVSSPKRKRPVIPKPRKKEGSKKQKPPSISWSHDSSSDEILEPPKEKKRKTKCFISKRATASIENIKPKKATDICNDLLAEWDDTDDELELDSTFDMTTSSIENDNDNKGETNEVTKNGENTDKCDVDTEVIENLEKDDYAEISDQSIQEEQESKETSKSTMDQETQEAIKSCFDFEEDEEEELINTTVQEGRKIPRVIPPTEKRKSEILDDIIDLEEGINKDEILKVSQSFNEKKSDNLELENVFKEFMDEVSVPKLPDVKTNLKPTQNFHCVKTIKFPDKLDDSPNKDRGKKESDTSSKLINPKKRFVKSFEDFENQLHREEIKRKEEAELQRKIRKQSLHQPAQHEQTEEDKEYNSTNINISHLQCSIMSKIIDEINISDESKQTIMSNIHKKKTPRGKILDSYLSDSASQSIDKNDQADNKEATNDTNQVATLKTDDKILSSTSRDPCIPDVNKIGQSQEEEINNLSINESDLHKQSRSPTFLDNTVADESIPQGIETESYIKPASILDSPVETKLTDHNPIETFKMKINKKLRKRSCNVDKGAIDDQSKCRKTRHSLEESTNTDYTCFDKHKSTTEQTIRKLSSRLSLHESQAYSASNKEQDTGKDLGKGLEKGPDDLIGTKNCDENNDTSKRVEAMSEDLSTEKYIDKDKDNDVKTGQCRPTTVGKCHETIEFFASNRNEDKTSIEKPIESELVKTRTGKKEKMMGQIVRKRSTRNSSKDIVITKDDTNYKTTYQNMSETTITEPLSIDGEAIEDDENKDIICKSLRKKTLSTKHKSEGNREEMKDNKNEKTDDKIDDIKEVICGETTFTYSESKMDEEIGDKGKNKRRSRRSLSGKLGSSRYSSTEKHDIPPKIITADTLTDELEVAVTKDNGNQDPNETMLKSEKLCELEAEKGFPEKLVALDTDDEKEQIVDETGNKQKSSHRVSDHLSEELGIGSSNEECSSAVTISESLIDDTEVIHKHRQIVDTLLDISGTHSSPEKYHEADEVREVLPKGDVTSDDIATKDKELPQRKRGSRHFSTGKYRTLKTNKPEEENSVKDYGEEVTAKIMNKRSSRSGKHDVLLPANIVERLSDELEVAVTKVKKNEQFIERTMPKRKCRQSSSEKYSKPETTRHLPVEVVETKDPKNEQIAFNLSVHSTKTHLSGHKKEDEEIVDKTSRRRSSRYTGKQNTIETKTRNKFPHTTEAVEETTVSEKNSSQFPSDTKTEEDLPGKGEVKEKESEGITKKVLKHKHVADRTMPKRSCRKSSLEKHCRTEITKTECTPDEFSNSKDDKNVIAGKQSLYESKREDLPQDIDINVTKDEEIVKKIVPKRSSRHFSSRKYRVPKVDDIKDDNDRTAEKIEFKQSLEIDNVLPQVNIAENLLEVSDQLSSEKQAPLETASTEQSPTEVEESSIITKDNTYVTESNSSCSSAETETEQLPDLTTDKDEISSFKTSRKRNSKQSSGKHHIRTKVIKHLPDEFRDITDKTGSKKSSPEKSDSLQGENLPSEKEVVAPTDHNEQIGDTQNSSQAENKISVNADITSTNEGEITDNNLIILEPKKGDLLSIDTLESSLSSQDNAVGHLSDKKDVDEILDQTNFEKKSLEKEHIEATIEIPVKEDDIAEKIDNEDEKIAEESEVSQCASVIRLEHSPDEIVIPTVDKNEEHLISETQVAFEFKVMEAKSEELVTTHSTCDEIENKTFETDTVEETELKGLSLERKETVTSLPRMQDLTYKVQIESEGEKQKVKVEDYSSKKTRYKGKFRHLSLENKVSDQPHQIVDTIPNKGEDTELNTQQETHNHQSDVDKIITIEKENSSIEGIVKSNLSDAETVRAEIIEDNNTPKNVDKHFDNQTITHSSSEHQQRIDIKQTIIETTDTCHSGDKLQEISRQQPKIHHSEEEISVKIDDNKGSVISEPKLKTKQESIELKPSSVDVQKPSTTLKKSQSSDTSVHRVVENREKLRLPFKKGRWSIRTSHPTKYRSIGITSTFQTSPSLKISPHSQSKSETGEGSQHKPTVKDAFTEDKSEIKKGIPTEDSSKTRDESICGSSFAKLQVNTPEELPSTKDEINSTDNEITVENMEHLKVEDIPKNYGTSVEKIEGMINTEPILDEQLNEASKDYHCAMKKSEDVVVTEFNTDTEQTISNSFIHTDKPLSNISETKSASESSKINESKEIQHANILGLNTSQFSVLCSQSEEFSVGNTSLELPEDAIYEPSTTFSTRTKTGKLLEDSYKKKQTPNEGYSDKNLEEKTIAAEEIGEDVSILTTESITNDEFQTFNQEIVNDSSIEAVEEETIFEVTIEDSVHNEEKLEEGSFEESKNADNDNQALIMSNDSISRETEESAVSQVKSSSLVELEALQESVTMESNESKDTYKNAEESILTEVTVDDHISIKEQTNLFDSATIFSYECSKDSEKTKQNDFEEYRTKIGNLFETSMQDRKGSNTDKTVTDDDKDKIESKKCITFDMPADDEDEKLTDLVSDIVQKLNRDESDKNQEELDMELEEEMHLTPKSPKKIHVASLQLPADISKGESDAIRENSKTESIDKSGEKSKDMDNQDEKVSNEVEIFCASNSSDSFKFCIQTNLSNLSKSEEISAIALATLSEVKTDVEVKSNTTEEIVPKVDLPSPEKLSDTEMAAIEGNLTVMSEKDLADAQVEITSEKVISSKKSIMLSSLSMDFSESTSTNSDKVSNEGSNEPRKHKEIDSKGTEFTSKAITKEYKPKILSKKINTYNQCELLNILEGNSEVEKKVVEFQTQAKSFTGDICDFEEHIPSQIVCTKQFKQDLDDEFKKKEKSSVISTTSKLLERLNEIKTDTKKEASSETVTKNIKQKPKLKPIILSEQIIKPASDPKKIIPPSNNVVNDIEDVEAFIIRKDIKKYVEVDETAQSPKQIRKPRQKTLGKANILHETIITPAGEIIQPAASLQKVKTVVVNAPASSTSTRTPADISLESSKTSKSATTTDATSQDDNVFDIFNMPIVLSDQILTPESIENMPIVIENNTPVNKPKQTPQPTKLIPNKVLTKIVPTGKSTVIATRSTNVSPKFTKPRLLQTVSKPGLSVTPNILSRSKPGKYILVSQSSGIAPQVKKTIIKKTSLPSNIPSKITGATEGTGHKIMVVTNQQGQQQRLLLTPAQQKVLGYQSPVLPKVEKSVIKPELVQKTVTLPTLKSEISNIKSTSSQKIITTAGQIITGAATPRPMKSVVKRTTTSSLPTQKATSTKTTKTILITNKHGQTIKKIATTEDDIDKQVAEQLEAIKASSGMHFSSQSKSESVPHKLLQKSPVRKSYNRKQDSKFKTIPVSTKSDNSSILTATTSKKVIPQVPETKKVVQEEPKPQIERPLNQLVIQDALGNQTTITEGQILALPSETVDGQPQSYMLVTLDQTGNLTPLNNEALMSLDPNLGLGGDLNNIVLQIDQGALAGNINQPTPLAQPATVKITNPGEELQAGTSKIEIPRETIPLSLPVANEVVPTVEQKIEESIMVAPTEASVNIVSNSNGEQGQQLIVTGDPIATQKFLESLSEGTTDLANIIANAEGKSILIQTDGQQILINTNTDSQMLTNIVESTEGNGNPVFATQPNKNTDILAAALADTDVFPTQSKVGSQLSPNHALYPINVGNVLETSLTLNSPIMTPLEVPSSNNKKIPDDEADILTQVPKNVDLPITITDPNISQTVANQQVATLIGNEFQANLELGLSIPEVTIAAVSTGLNSPGYNYSLSTLDDNDISHKPFNSSMPLLNDDVDDSLSGKKCEKDDHKSQQHISAGSFLVEESRFTLGGSMCSSLSEPPPEMFDIPDNTFGEKNANNIPLSLQSTPDPKDDDGSIQTESSSEGSCEIPLQPKIVAKSADLNDI
ncbi:titin homolog isoform X1 [Diorhabda carinulata]|uniref:titin homolog isoform X1 n=1 Tax=Diorhabda carinulata TaxID=1163345 RepID=UPI0025A2AEAD|nr:titin homolog isoform X1 [Diorhabda carinulata]